MKVGMLGAFIQKYGVINEGGWLKFDLHDEDKFLVQYVHDTQKRGFSEHKEKHEKYLQLGDIYKVEKFRINDSFTLYFFEGVPDGYNSIHFEVLEN